MQIMRVNANTVAGSRVATKTSATPAILQRRAVSVRASKGVEPKAVSPAAALQEGARSGLAAVSAFCLGVSLLVSPVEPAQAVLPPDNGAGLIKSGANALPQPLNKLTQEASEYKDPATEAKKDTAQYSDVDYTKKASDKIKGGLESIKETITGAAEDVKSNASDTASDIKSSANKLSNKVAFLGFGENKPEKIKGAIQEKVGGNIGIQTSNVRENIDRITDSVKGDGKSTLFPLNSGQNGPKSVNAFTQGAAGWQGDKKKNGDPGSAPNTVRPVSEDPASDNKGDPNKRLLSPQTTKDMLNNVLLNGDRTDAFTPQATNNNVSNIVSGKVQQDVQATKNTLRSVKNDGGDQIKAGTKDALDNSKDSVKSVNALLQGKAGSAKNAVSDKVEDLGDAAKGAVKNVKYSAQDVADSAKSTADKINPLSNVGFVGVGDQTAAQNLNQDKGGKVIDGAKGLTTNYVPNNYVPETGGYKGASFLNGKINKDAILKNDPGEKASNAVDGAKGLFNSIKNAGADAAENIKYSASEI